MRTRLPLHLVLASSLLLAALPARGESPAAAPAESKADLIRRLMAVSGSDTVGMQIMTQLLDTFRMQMPEVPAEFWDGFAKEIDSKQLVEMIVPVYDRHFAEQDLRDLIAFYATPTGRKLVAAMPQIAAESMAIGMEWGKAAAERVVKALAAKGYQPKT